MDVKEDEDVTLEVQSKIQDFKQNIEQLHLEALKSPLILEDFLTKTITSCQALRVIVSDGVAMRENRLADEKRQKEEALAEEIRLTQEREAEEKRVKEENDRAVFEKE